MDRYLAESMPHTEEPAGGTPEWNERWSEREEEAKELLYGKKRGDRAVVKREPKGEEEGKIETDWIITTYNKDSEGKNRVVVTRREGNRTDIKHIREEEFWRTNFAGSEDIVDELKRDLRKKRSYGMFSEESRKTRDREVKKSRDRLNDFMNGDFESTRDYYYKKLDQKVREREVAKKIFEEAAERLNEVRDKVSKAGIEAIGDLKQDLRHAENYFSEKSGDFQRASNEAGELSKVVQTLDKKIEESK